LTDEGFYTMTMREFHALTERWKSAQEWLNVRTAMVCTVMVNMWRSPKSKAAKIEDFMPGQHKPEPQTAEQMLAAVQLLNAAHGGKVVFGQFGDN